MPGHNHYPSCNCGWCSGGWGGGGGNTQPLRTVHPIGTRTSWDASDFCRPSKCPICGDQVFFVRHNGGSVWFDELGPPWPKHACFDEGYTGRALRTVLERDNLEDTHKDFGIVTETEVIIPCERGRIVIVCSNGLRIENVYDTNWDLVALAGSLVVISTDVDTSKHQLHRVSYSSYGGWRSPPSLVAGVKLFYEGQKYILRGSKWCSVPGYSIVSTSMQEKIERYVEKLLSKVK